MRTIQTHKVNAANDAIDITADEPGQGNMSHEYVLSVQGADRAIDTLIRFQNGPIKEAGVNGLTNEALLAIVIDRLRGAQAGPYSCRENALALTKLEEGAMWLFERTRNRAARGVEGTHEK
jgi:hypothetical protein